MAMLDSLKDTLNRSVATVSAKSETLVESSRVKSAISAAQKKMEAGQLTLGVKLYQSWKTGETNIDLFAEDLERIKEVEEEINGLNARLEQIKAEEEARILNNIPVSSSGATGAIFCTNCGRPLPAGSRFCDECGTPVA